MFSTFRQKFVLIYDVILHIILQIKRMSMIKKRYLIKSLFFGESVNTDLYLQ